MQRICATIRTLPAGFSFVPSLAPKLISARCYSTRRPGFFAQFFKNVQVEIEKSKEVKENVQKFREEAQKLEQSEALLAARQKFNTVESQASKGGQVLKQNVAKIQNRMAKVLKDATDTELGKRLSETISQKGQAIGQSGALRGFSATARAVQQELDSQSVDTRVYRSPAKLQKRLELANGTDDTSSTTVQPNAAATAVELHKDSKFYQSWESFKTNNQHWNRLLALKIQYDESENVAIRTSRALTDKIHMFPERTLHAQCCECIPTSPLDQRTASTWQLPNGTKRGSCCNPLGVGVSSACKQKPTRGEDAKCTTHIEKGPTVRKDTLRAETVETRQPMRSPSTHVRRERASEVASAHESNLFV
ncbi:mitochondrial import inner membrane translocase subunit TIM44-like isoform X2 [Anopheles arabiensis]|uniref:mitochondrial import inner membrane translocase subunit TIM44-like isoform X2 n=1 Tax=Anopheles arabiensis TaxID=7173 RepID=UPI001AAD39E0|nr:mitochondrial import inner membrane translocase subunit TIM44-like isoform X2 [Anopheles arabiensis]